MFAVCFHYIRSLNDEKLTIEKREREKEGFIMLFLGGQEKKNNFNLPLMVTQKVVLAFYEVISSGRQMAPS